MFQYFEESHSHVSSIFKLPILKLTAKIRTSPPSPIVTVSFDHSSSMAARCMRLLPLLGLGRVDICCFCPILNWVTFQIQTHEEQIIMEQPYCCTKAHPWPSLIYTSIYNLLSLFLIDRKTIEVSFVWDVLVPSQTFKISKFATFQDLFLQIKKLVAC